VGDFSGITVDPTTGTTYWAANEYAIATTDVSLPNWGTWIASFHIVAPTPPGFNWTGNGSTSNWSDPQNWSGGVAPSAGSNLVFGPSAAKSTSTDDFPAGTRFGSITFTGGGYAIGGNGIVLTIGLDASNATGSNSFTPAITLSTAETFLAGSGSTVLIVGGPLNDSGFNLTVGGGNGELDLTNVISGRGGLIIANSGTTILSGSGNSFTGTTNVKSGTLMLQCASGNAIPGNLTIGAATVQLNAGNQIADTAALTLTGAGLLDTNSNSDTIASLSLSGSSVTTGAGTLTVLGSVTDSGASTISGGLALGGTSQTFQVNSGGTLAITASISGGGLKKNGSGTLVLSSSNSYTGGTTLIAGALMVGNGAALGNGVLSVQGGTLGASGGPLSLSNAVTLAGNLTIGGSDALTLSGPVTLTGNRTLTVNDTGGTTIAGAIGQAGGARKLTKGGAGTLVLSASNTYTGATSVSGGTLLVNGSIMSSVTVASGATLGGSGATGAVTVLSGGVLLPGGSGQPGILSTGGVTFKGGANFNVALDGSTPGAGGYAQLEVSGTVSLNNSYLNVSVGYAAALGASFTIIKNDGPKAVSGIFKNLAEGAIFVVGSMTFRITYKGGTSGRDVVITRVA
jgi:autotransporter-associated beta strand protein